MFEVKSPAVVRSQNPGHLRLEPIVFCQFLTAVLNSQSFVDHPQPPYSYDMFLILVIDSKAVHMLP